MIKRVASAYSRQLHATSYICPVSLAPEYAAYRTAIRMETTQSDAMQHAKPCGSPSAFFYSHFVPLDGQDGVSTDAGA